MTVPAIRFSGSVCQKAFGCTHEDVELIVMRPVAGAIKTHSCGVTQVLERIVLSDAVRIAPLCIDEQDRTGDFTPQRFGVLGSGVVRRMSVGVVVEFPRVVARIS